jgi:hypothetical protein
MAPLVAISGAFPSAVVRANNLPTCGSGSGQPCVFGNLEVLSLSGNLFEKHTGGGSGCDANGQGGANLAVDNSNPLNPGYSITAKSPCTHTGVGTFSQSETIQLAGLNGLLIHDLSASITCGVTGNDSLSLSFNSLTLNCPTEKNPEDFGTVSGHITFIPGSTLTETITLTATGFLEDFLIIDSMSNNISLVRASTAPEANTIFLLCAGLVGLLGTRRRLLHR